MDGCIYLLTTVAFPSQLCADLICVSFQTEAAGRVESDSDEEHVRGVGGNFRSGLHQGSQQGWRGHLGGAASLQAGVC